MIGFVQEVVLEVVWAVLVHVKMDAQVVVALVAAAVMGVVAVVVVLVVVVVVEDAKAVVMDAVDVQDLVLINVMQAVAQTQI